MTEQSHKLPKIRQDLKLYPGPVAANGARTWQLYDPVRNQYFRVGLLEFELLSRWQCGDVNKLVHQVNTETTLLVNHEAVANLIKFLELSHLLECHEESLTQQMIEKSHQVKRQHLKQLLRSYLFIRISLFRPDRFLEKTLFIVRPLFSRYILWLFALLTIISFYLVGRRWDQFTHTFIHFFNLQGLVYYILAILLVKIIHEFAHAYTAKYYGCRVASMGLALLVLWPVLYTDTTDAWRLQPKMQRVAIGVAGMVVEIALATLALFLWAFLSPGPLQSICFILATSSWLLTVIVNLNPCLRFDGYYILSDLIDVSNLQHKAFALGKWQLRELILGLGEARPYQFSSKLHYFLIVYAYVTWSYRLFLFIGISLLIYFLFFKLLGIILMVLTLVMLVITPIIKEIGECVRRRDLIKLNRHSIISLCCVVVLLVLLVIPWRSTLSVPAVMGYQNVVNFHAAKAAKVIYVKIKQNQLVRKGEKLMELESPQLNFDLHQTALEIASLQYQLKQESRDPQIFDYRQATLAELLKKQSEHRGLLAIKRKLTLSAPFAGRVVDIKRPFTKGEWISEETKLFEVINLSQITVQAFVPEEKVQSIELKQQVEFDPNIFSRRPIPLKIRRVSPLAVQKVTSQYVVSTFGGDIAVYQNKQGDYIPQQAWYRVDLVPVALIKLPYKVSGTAYFKTTAHSVIARLGLVIYRALIKESGF